MPQQVIVTAKPSSRKGPLVETGPDGAITIFVREPATEGKANKAVVAFLSRVLQVRKSQVSILRGETSREKTVRVEADAPQWPLG